MITIGFSTRKDNPEYVKHLQKMFGHPKIQIIQKINNGEKSLSQTYNEILSEAKFNYVVFLHDDLIIETKNLTPKILKIFNKNPDYGIIGIAGTTDLIDGCWWTLKKSSTGIVNHQKDGKKWESKFSPEQNNEIKEVVVLDGLFIIVNKNKIKHIFDETFNGFHFYDLSFCFPNHLDGVKIGVTTQVRVTHLSVGETNNKWEESKKQFEEKYKDKLPTKLTNNKTIDELLQYTKNSIGIGIVTYNSEERIKQSANRIPKCYKNFVIVNDGTPYNDSVYPENAHIIQHERNLSVGAAKNSAIKYLMDNGCEHIFILEDDLLIKDENVFDEYIRHSIISGIKHLNFGLSDDIKNKHEGKPNPKLLIPYQDGIKISLYHDCFASLQYFRREVIEKIGYFDTQFVNAMEHVDYTFMTIKHGFHPPMWFFADIENSQNYLEMIPNNESIINKSTNLNEIQKRAIFLFKNKHGYLPGEISQVNNDMLNKILMTLYINR